MGINEAVEEIKIFQENYKKESNVPCFHFEAGHSAPIREEITHEYNEGPCTVRYIKLVEDFEIVGKLKECGIDYLQWETDRLRWIKNEQ